MIALLIAAGVAFAFNIVLTPFLIRALRARGIGQLIRDDGPFAHPHAAKAGTPTMGGIAIVGGVVLGYAVAHVRTEQLKFARTGLLLVALIVGLAVVGFVDDYLGVKAGRNLGLRKRGKMAGLLVVSGLFAYLALDWVGVTTNVSFTRPTGPDLTTVGWFVLAILVVTASSNGVNLTDGMDGLAAGSATLVFMAFTIICFWQFRHFDVYMIEPAAAVDLAVVSAALAGACGGFLWWNAAPAQIFMGDTGSLAIGGAMAGLALLSATILLLPILGGLYVVETLSVIAQVISFRGFGRRVLRMAPIHHHFEVGGWPEFTVIVRLWLFAGACVALALGLFYADFINIPGVIDSTRVAVLGLGVTGDAVVRWARARGDEVVLVDDRPDAVADERLATARDLGVALQATPTTPPKLDAFVAGLDLVVPSPGVPERHALVVAAERAGVPVRGEVDVAAELLAARRRAFVAITGTNGKTTVTELTVAMLEASGVRAVAAGNIGAPLLDAARDDDAPDGSADLPVVVAEVSSFQLATTTGAFRPHAAAILNLADDHLDWHRTFAAYAAAKARIFSAQEPDDLVVYNADDPVVAGLVADAPGRTRAFSVVDGAAAGYRVVATATGRVLVAADGTELAAVDDLPATAAHDLANALAAAALALEVGGTPAGVGAALREFARGPHRLHEVATIDGIRYVDDSKATNVHAALAAVRTFPRVVLIAGGRNKGLDLSGLRAASDHVVAVVAIGDAADEVEDAFRGVKPVLRATSMVEAVRAARDAATAGDVVLLSPACASFDWYRSYGERGEDFARVVAALREAAR